MQIRRIGKERKARSAQVAKIIFYLLPQPLLQARSMAENQKIHENSKGWLRGAPGICGGRGDSGPSRPIAKSVTGGAGQICHIF